MTILPLPVFNSYLATIICNTSSTFTSNVNCSSPIYYVHLSVALIGLIKFIFLCLIFSYLYIDMNPCSKIPFACPQTIMPLIKLGIINLFLYFLYSPLIFNLSYIIAIKLLLPFYVTLDYGG